MAKDIQEIVRASLISADQDLGQDEGVHRRSIAIVSS
jgi:hypothetical protein